LRHSTDWKADYRRLPPESDAITMPLDPTAERLLEVMTIEGGLNPGAGAGSYT
jgi:hypothetical protein